jgi:chemotaxis protein methyltransferase CheR
MRELNEVEFFKLKKIIYDCVGMSLESNKTAFLHSRLYNRLLYYEVDNFTSYLQILQNNDEEKKELINLITINETYFFREHQHFKFLSNLLNQKIDNPFRIWSAASSVGAEAFSIAMILEQKILNESWHVTATDINTHVIEKAKKGLYKESWVEKIPSQYKNKYCLKGKDTYEGQFLIDKTLQKKITFDLHNLIDKNNTLGLFDVIFLRNVFIYFSVEIRQKVLNNVLENLKNGGYLIISLTENLDGLDANNLIKMKNSIYQKKTTSLKENI